MQLDDELCLCFHVTKRKVVNFLQVERPARVGQLSECFGAGTGCGWCRPFLQKLFEEAIAQRKIQSASGLKGENPSVAGQAEELSAAEYARLRANYRAKINESPPTPAAPE